MWQLHWTFIYEELNVINDNWQIRGEAEQYEVNNLDVDVASIGFSFAL
ncbi:MAG: hypothetical protein ACI82O_004090 [Patiriisocius sp.]